jgi:phenylacetate-CoA ligase
LTVCATSGSSGTPVRTYWSNEDFRRSLALREARGCRPAGVSYRQPRATFSGRLVVPDATSTGPFYRFNLAERQVYFSAFHLSPQNAADYVRALHRHHIVWATGYTHAYEQLGLMMLEQQLAPPPSLRAIITTSEKLTPSGREIIERAFGCRVYQEYGQVEDACWACERADGRLYVSPDAGILELVRADGSVIPIDDPSEGQVVATSLIRRSQIFLRYRLGDVACWDPEASRRANTPILRDISGRIEDVIVAPDGRRTVRFHGIFTEMPGVREAQVIQEARDLLRIRVVASPSYGPDTVDEIVRRIQVRLTTEMRVEVERVDLIPRTAAGKFQAVISRIAR